MTAVPAHDLILWLDTYKLNNILQIFPDKNTLVKPLWYACINMSFFQSTGARVRTLIGTVFPSLIVGPETRSRMYPLYNFFSYCMEEFGYMHIQATKPDTVGE